MHTVAFRISSVLWVIWGIVHMLAGFMIMSSDASGGFAAVADAVDPEAVKHTYHAAVGAILNQHGWNLAWIGLTTVVCAPFIWRGTPWAIFLAALTGGMADIGYFLFLDLGGHVHFMPGTLMTIFSGSAILLSFGAHFTSPKSDG